MYSYLHFSLHETHNNLNCGERKLPPTSITFDPPRAKKIIASFEDDACVINVEFLFCSALSLPRFNGQKVQRTRFSVGECFINRRWSFDAFNDLRCRFPRKYRSFPEEFSHEFSIPRPGSREEALAPRGLRESLKLSFPGKVENTDFRFLPFSFSPLETRILRRQISVRQHDRSRYNLTILTHICLVLSAF